MFGFVLFSFVTAEICRIIACSLLLSWFCEFVPSVVLLYRFLFSLLCSRFIGSLLGVWVACVCTWVPMCG